ECCDSYGSAFFVVETCPPFRRCHEVFVSRYRKARGHPALCIDILTLAGFDSNLFDEVPRDFEHRDARCRVSRKVRFLRRDLLTDFNGLRIVGDDLAVDTVLEWCDNASAICIVFRVGREHKLDIKRKPKLKASYLNIAFLKDVEQRNLYSCLEVGKLVDHEDATVRSRDQSEVDHAFIGVR